MHTMCSKELWQVSVLGVCNDDRKITPNDDLPAESRDVFNKPPEIRIHLWGAPCKINRSNFRSSQYIQALLHCFPGHDLRTVRTRINMTMFACLITHLPHVHL